MDEQAKLKAKIAAMTGRIDLHKRRAEPYPPPAYHASNHPHQGGGRWTARGRGARVGHHHPRQSQNLVWVASGTQTPPSEKSVALPDADVLETPPAGMKPRNGFILPPPSNGKRELMSKETYEREQKQKQEYQLARAAEPRLETSSPAPKPSAPARTEQTPRNITLEGLTFQISNDGSKLMRLPDDSNVFQVTPKKATVAGVDFHRTKHGNLMRAPATDNTTRYKWRGPRTSRSTWLKSFHRFNTSVSKAQCETFTRLGNLSSPRDLFRGWPTTRWHLPYTGNWSASEPATDILTGSCPFGPKCRFAHDPEKVSICKAYLKNGTCNAGDYCDLSHEMSYHRVSACTHFLRGNCTNDACRYPHVNISPSATVCRAFATLGYCACGEKCSRRHVFECPSHANRGVCTNQNCQLPHVDRASVMRRAAQRQAKIGSEGESDLSSDEDIDDGGVSDEESELDEADAVDNDAVMSGVNNSHSLSQQQDYVAFS